VKTAESMSIEVIRLLMLASHQSKVARVTVQVNDQVASYLNNKKRKEITQLEESGGITVQILGSEAHFPEHLVLDCRDEEGREVPLG
jgi:ribonuclease E